jgi:hypothetical protein
MARGERCQKGRDFLRKMVIVIGFLSSIRSQDEARHQNPPPRSSFSNGHESNHNNTAMNDIENLARQDDICCLIWIHNLINIEKLSYNLLHHILMSVSTSNSNHNSKLQLQGRILGHEIIREHANAHC